MKKFTKKLLITLVAAIAVVCATVSLAACGGAAKTTGYYTANKQIDYTHYASNFFWIVVNQESIETYDDGTYCLEVNGLQYSNITAGANVETNQFTANENLHATIKYYGTFTEKDKEEGNVTLVLAKPTRVVYALQNQMLMDTANWTDAMSAAVSEEGKDPVTAEKYLEGKINTEVFTESGLEVFVLYSSYSFEAIEGLKFGMLREGYTAL